MNKAKIQEALRRASRPELAEALRVAEAKCDALERELFPELFSGEQIAASQSSKALSTAEVVELEKRLLSKLERPTRYVEGVEFLRPVGFAGGVKLWESVLSPAEAEPGTDQINTAELVAKFLQSRRGTIAEGSLVSYRHTLMIFAKHCPQLPTKPEELESYFARFLERRSAASAYSPIKQLYEFSSLRYSLPNAMKSVKRARFKEKEPYSFTLDEARAVLNACRNDRELGLAHLYLGHGFRLDEACRVNVGDVLDGQIMVRGKERTEYMPLLPETRDVLLRLADGRSSKEPIFTSHKGRRLCHKETYNVVKTILKRAGVTEGKDGQRIATHTLRKTFATLVTHAGCNDRLVKRLLRHKTADITKPLCEYANGDPESQSGTL